MTDVTLAAAARHRDRHVGQDISDAVPAVPHVRRHGMAGAPAIPPAIPPPPPAIRRKIRVLVVIPTLDVGGAEMDVVHNVPLLDPARFHVIVCTLLKRGELAPRLDALGIEMIGPDLWQCVAPRPVQQRRQSVSKPWRAGLRAARAKAAAARHALRGALSAARARAATVRQALRAALWASIWALRGKLAAARYAAWTSLYWHTPRPIWRIVRQVRHVPLPRIGRHPRVRRRRVAGMLRAMRRVISAGIGRVSGAWRSRPRARLRLRQARRLVPRIHWRIGPLSLLGLPPGAVYAYWQLCHPLTVYIRQAKIDVVHVILPNSYVVGGLACALTRRRLVMSRLSLNWYQRSLPFYRVLERRVLHRLVDVAIGNSGAILNDLRDEGVAARKLRLIHNGIPVGAFRTAMGSRERAREQLGIGHDALVFSSVGNLFSYKGHADLLAALHLANPALRPGWVLLVIGRDNDGAMAELEATCGRYGMTGNVRFLGQRSDVPVILCAADIHLTATHTEGFPNNILEAMCAGLPVIATAVGGIPELVVDGETGVLVPARQPAAMAAAIIGLAGDPVRFKAMGQAGHERVLDRFSIERSVAALEEIYAG